jgi:hypothetical protein
LVGTLAAAVACGFGSAFVCEDDAECNDGGELGVCHASGHCSFPDDTCPSGQRYGEHGTGDLAGDCVAPGDDTGGSAEDTTSASASGEDDPSLDDDASSLDTAADSVDPATSTGPVGLDDTGSSGIGGSTDDGDAESSGGPVEVDPDLVLWMTFDDPESPLADASMYAREVSCDLATDACPTVVADGAMDLGALFDGTNDLLEVPHDPALETDDGLTVAVRVRNDALSLLPIHTVIARPYDILTENSWELFFRDDSGDGVNDVVFEIADPGGQIQLIVTAPVAKGEWVRIAAVWTVDSVALYFDGVLQTEAPATGMLLDDSSVVIGGDFDNLVPSHWFVGAIDDVRVFRRALTGAEVAALP